MEKVSKRVNAIQEVKESVSLLSQLLEGYNKESCSQSNQELIKVSTAQHSAASFNPEISEPAHASHQRDSSVFSDMYLSLQDLYQRCEKMRPTLFRLASDTEDSDEALGTFTDLCVFHRTLCNIFQKA